VLRPARVRGIAAPARDCMMTHGLGGMGSGNLLFGCGHENPAGNHYCGVCGAPKDRPCPFCDSPSRGNAKFCGTCGARLLDDRVRRESIVVGATPRPPQDPAPRSTVPAAHERARRSGPDNQLLLDNETPRWRRAGGWRRDAFDDVTEQAEGEAADRWRTPFLLAAVAVTVAIAILLGAGQLSSRRYGGFLDHFLGWVTDDRASVPARRSEEPSGPEGIDPSASSAARPSETAATRTPTGEPAQDATEVRAVPSRAEPPAASPSLPARSPSEWSAAPGGDASSRGTPGALAPTAETSEERMADFLVEELGPTGAAEKALSTAAWYDTDRSEHAYWQRVADAIKRRGGS
jgi:hypothetical protein